MKSPNVGRSPASGLQRHESGPEDVSRRNQPLTVTRFPWASSKPEAALEFLELTTIRTHICQGVS